MSSCCCLKVRDPGCRRCDHSEPPTEEERLAACAPEMARMLLHIQTQLDRFELLNETRRALIPLLRKAGVR